MFLRRLFNAVFGSAPPTPQVQQRPRTIVTTPVVPPPGFYDGYNRHQRESIQSTHKSSHKRDRIPAEVREAVWTTYHGNRSQGICYACGKIIQRYHGGWHCSHVISDVKGGHETVENLRTCCQHCNLSMGDQNLYVYILEKKLSGPGAKNARTYLARHPSQQFDKRTNNWGKPKKTKVNNVRNL